MAASVGGTDGLVVDKLDGATVGRGVVGAAEGLMLGAIEWEYVGDEEGLAVIASLGCVLGLTGRGSTENSRWHLARANRRTKRRHR